MKTLFVPKINVSALDAGMLPGIFDERQIGFEPLVNVNWQEYPYLPAVGFRLGHTGKDILIQYSVMEATVRAEVGEDNGPVWEDSCVEFFVAPQKEGIYYNIECNSTGHLLLGAGKDRKSRIRAEQKILDGILRWSSLGTGDFQERIAPAEWTVCLVIPVSCLFLSVGTTLEGQSMYGNFYKCGNRQLIPHYLSWNPIHLEKPDFHCPDFFGKILFE